MSELTFSHSTDAKNGGNVKQAAAAMARRGKMQESQAREILNIPPETPICLETVEEVRPLYSKIKATLISNNMQLQQYTKFFAANDPKEGGSFYLQSKIYRAKEAMEHAHTESLKPKQEEE